jgi:ribosomal protein S27E
LQKNPVLGLLYEAGAAIMTESEKSGFNHKFVRMHADWDKYTLDVRWIECENNDWTFKHSNRQANSIKCWGFLEYSGGCSRLTQQHSNIYVL